MDKSKSWVFITDFKKPNSVLNVQAIVTYHILYMYLNGLLCPPGSLLLKKNHKRWKLQHHDDTERPGLFSVAPDRFVCDVLGMSKIVKYHDEDQENIFLTLEQSLAMLRERRLYSLDIRYCLVTIC